MRNDFLIVIQVMNTQIFVFIFKSKKAFIGRPTAYGALPTKSQSSKEEKDEK